MRGAKDWLLGGWQVSGIYSYQNAVPLAFTTSLTNPLFGGPVRPNVTSSAFRAPVAGESFNPFKDNYINPGFMTLPSAFTLGTAALNYNYRGFAPFNEDMALAKTFRIKERVRCDFRWEAYNSFNRVVW